jgi:hypothetical protein
MDILPLSTIPHFPHCPPPFSSNTTTTTTTASISFSLKPPPPPPPEPTNSSSIRRPKSLNPTPAPTPTPTPTPAPTTPKIPQNPLKTLLNPSKPQITSSSATSTTDPLSLSTKLRLSSKLSHPPPPPPPLETTRTPEAETQETRKVENEAPKTDFCQKGKIFIGNLPNWIKKHELSEFFRQFGPIKNVVLINGHNETERNAGFGFIIYDGPTAEKSAMKAEEFDGMEFHGRVLTVKLDDGRRLKAKAEERKNWVDGEDGGDYRSKWHEEREGSTKAFRKVLDTQPENWQAVVSAFERIKKVKGFRHSYC